MCGKSWIELSVYNVYTIFNIKKFIASNGLYMYNIKKIYTNQNWKEKEGEKEKCD
jgi:hypothetical protein